MATYVLPIMAFAVLLVMILRDTEQYKREHPSFRTRGRPSRARGQPRADHNFPGHLFALGFGNRLKT